MAEGMELSILLKLRDEASNAMAGLTRRLEEQKRSWEKYSQGVRAAGTMLTAAGGVITAASALAVKGAFDQQQTVNLLDNALKRLNIDYRQHRVAIEGAIQSLQRKTNYSDEAQRESLRKLLLVTRDYDLSLKALPLVLDVAAGANLDLESAALLVGKALIGNTEALKRYGVDLTAARNPTEALAMMTERFKGSAEAAANPIVQLKNRLGEMQEAFAIGLLPAISKVAEVIGVLADKFAAFANEHPKIAAVLSGTVVVFGLVAVAMGGLLLLLPGLIAGFATFEAVILPLLLPIAGIALVLVGLAAAAVVLWLKWDEVWGWMKDAAEGKSGLIIVALGALLGPIGLLVAGLLVAWQNWDEIWGWMKDAFITVTDALGSAWDSSWGWLKDGIPGALNTLKDAWGEGWGWIQDTFSMVSDTISTTFTSKWGWLLPGGVLALAITAIKEQWDEIWNGISNTIGGIWGSITDVVKGGINTLIGALNVFIRGINAIQIRVPRIKVPFLPDIPGFTVGMPNIPEIPRLQRGGIALSPQLALVGEAGPEAIIPLRHGLGGMGNLTVNLTIANSVIGIDDLEEHIRRTITDAYRRGAFAGVLG